jgi:hypothetical protein
MSDIKNPLLDFSDLPRFDTFQPEYVTEGIASLIHDAHTVVAQLEAPSSKVTWENFVSPLEETAEKLSRAWGIVGHLNAVVDTPALRATYNENQPKVTEFWTALAQNLTLFEKYKVDLLCKRAGKVIGYAEVEVREPYGNKFPFTTVHVPARKVKLLDNGLPTVYFAVNRDFTRLMWVRTEKIAQYIPIEVPNKMIPNGECFYNVPKKLFTEVYIGN